MAQVIYGTVKKYCGVNNAECSTSRPLVNGWFSQHFCTLISKENGMWRFISMNLRANTNKGSFHFKQHAEESSLNFALVINILFC